jgi:hypothetical protein
MSIIEFGINDYETILDEVQASIRYFTNLLNKYIPKERNFDKLEILDLFKIIKL